ncbi:hypothetical protein NL676_021671 [Syzygium grande]|nr:hypothetical protein NL676_021671 [Syzygium grande]
MELIKDAEGLEPVSPTGHYFNSKVMLVSVLAMWEFEIPIDDLQTTSLIKDVFLPINPRFSSIMVVGKKGGRKWKKVEVNVENHVHFPCFSSPMGTSSPSENDGLLKSYISQIAMQPYPEGQPLWEIHIIQCPTSEAQGTLIFKLHHALGDGYSLVGALLSCLQRAHDPSLPVKPGDSQFSDPLKFVHKAHEVIKRKRSSFSVVLTGKPLEIMKKCRNAEAVAKHISRTLRNSSMVISNVMGPMEKLSLGNHPVKSLYFTSLGIMIFSYAGNLRVAVRAEQGFIDSELYTRSLLDAFDMILHDACGKQ